MGGAANHCSISELILLCVCSHRRTGRGPEAVELQLRDATCDWPSQREYGHIEVNFLSTPAGGGGDKLEEGGGIDVPAAFMWRGRKEGP